jgi:hypothetical protein
MKTQLIIFHRPFNGILSASTNESSLELATGTNYTYTQASNSNETFTKSYQSITRPASRSTGGVELDLYDNVNIPITYSILDIREPEKRRTSWSKTVTIPGTRNNNRVFSHIYEIGQDGWVTIGNTSVYQGFNPNLKKEIIVLNDGIQVLKGNLQLKTIKKDKEGNIEYEIALSGELTSLFYDIGNAKLSDLDWSEWDHFWNKDTITKSWDGTCIRNGVDYASITNGTTKNITAITKNAQTGRLEFTTSTNHSLSEEDWVKISLDTSSNFALISAEGEWQVADVISTTKFAVNYFYPVSLPVIGVTGTLGTLTKRTATGKGYVYPMISWGDEFDDNSFAVTNFVPGFYVKEIWDKIMGETKSTYQSTFLNSQFFKRLMIIQKRSSYDLTPIEYSSRKFWVGLESSYLTAPSFKTCNQWYWLNVNTTSTATSSIFPFDNAIRTPFLKEAGSSGTASFYDNNDNWNEDTYKWIVKDTGQYGLSINVKLDAWCDMNGYANTLYNTNNGKTALYDGTASFSAPSGSNKYYPTPFDFTSNVFNGEPGVTNGLGTGIRVKAEMKLLRNGQVTTITDNKADFIMNAASYYTATNANWKYFGRYQPSTFEGRSLQVSTNYYFKEGDEVWVELRTFLSAKPNVAYAGRARSISFVQNGVYPIIGEWFVRVKEQSYIVNDPSPYSTEGSIIQAQSWLPRDMSCKDFLLSVIKSFNLHIEQDKQIDRKYYIEPRDEYYYDGTLTTHFEEWTEKTDPDTVEIRPMGELIAKYYTFENKDESDFWNKKFKEDRGRSFMKYTKTVDNDFLQNEVKISTLFGSTVMINNPAGSDVVMPAILQKESNGSAKPVSNSLPRMLIWGGKRPYTAQRGGAPINLNNANYANNTTGWELLSDVNNSNISASSSIYNYYPYAGTVDSPADPIRDINWYNMEEGDFVYYDIARWTNENLYNKYWSNFINEISDPTSKVITASLLLTPTDIFSLDFRKIYVIDGHWLRLQKVMDYDPITDGLTKCEFLKLKSPTKFGRQSVVVDAWGTVGATFVENVDTSRPVTSTFKEVAPFKKRPLSGYNNATPGSNISNNATIVTNGLSNYVANGAKNISINGNECFVGNDASNVNISGGNGVYVSGGVQNVNIIGTSKVKVTESDVTYINGVRYKNGMPISKSSVIDGGSDDVIRRQSNSTTANVIDASEDVVISAGSTAYENVVNAGQDAILPDVPELGISTFVNPNPRTNLSGGYDTTSATASTTEIVRNAAFKRS